MKKVLDFVTLFSMRWRLLFNTKFYGYIYNLIEIAVSGWFDKNKTSAHNSRGKTIYFDLSRSYDANLKSGIPRVVRSLFYLMVKKRDNVVPIYFPLFAKGAYEINVEKSEFEFRIKKTTRQVQLSPGDVFISFDADREEIIDHIEDLRGFVELGGQVIIGIHDLFPITNPEWFEPKRREIYIRYINQLKNFAKFICISKSTKRALQENFSDIPASNIFTIGLGCDFLYNRPSENIPERSISRERTTQGKIFIVVGTIEPRKNISYIVRCFTFLWRAGADYRLLIIGKRGWLAKSIVADIVSSKYYKTKLFWQSNVDDKKLEMYYKTASALIVSSFNEGFCLPIAEAIFYKCPVIANDLPIFHEIFSDKIAFFNANLSPEEFSAQFANLLEIARNRIRSSGVVTTWRDSCEQLESIIKQIEE